MSSINKTCFLGLATLSPLQRENSPFATVSKISSERRLYHLLIIPKLEAFFQGNRLSYVVIALRGRTGCGT